VNIHVSGVLSTIVVKKWNSGCYTKFAHENKLGMKPSEQAFYFKNVTYAVT